MFDVNVGLCQGCVLSQLLFCLYINSLVDELKKSSSGVECGRNLETTSLFASDGPGIKKSLEVLMGSED